MPVHANHFPIVLSIPLPWASGAPRPRAYGATLVTYTQMQPFDSETSSPSGKSVALLELDAYQWMTRMSPLVLDTLPGTKSAAQRHLSDLIQQLQTGLALQQSIQNADLNPSIVTSIT